MDVCRARRPGAPGTQGGDRRGQGRGPRGVRAPRGVRGRPRGAPPPTPPDSLCGQAARRTRPGHVRSGRGGLRGRPLPERTRGEAAAKGRGVSDVGTLPDLAARRLGGMVIVANDEFFAPKESLLKPEDPVFDPDRYTDRGKEMDGWETRRRREPGHDWCIVRLGIPGVVRGAVVDTSFFRGNYPDRCSLEGAAIDGDDIEGCEWFDLLPESPLEGDSVNRFVVASPNRVTHLRLNIFPDGGLARLRVLGEPLPDLKTLADAAGRTELAGSLSGGLVLDASDLFFSSPHNLIAPGDSHGMHDGWETRRRRGEGRDWVVLQLAAEAEIERVEVDTTNFKGNYPDSCSLDGRVGLEGAGEPDWSEVLSHRRLGPHRRFAFPIDPSARASHVRLNIHPD